MYFVQFLILSILHLRNHMIADNKRTIRGNSEGGANKHNVEIWLQWKSWLFDEWLVGASSLIQPGKQNHLQSKSLLCLVGLGWEPDWYKPHPHLLILLLKQPSHFFPHPKLLADHSPPLKHVFAGGHCREPFKSGQKERTRAAQRGPKILSSTPAFPNLTDKTASNMILISVRIKVHYPFKYGLDVVPGQFYW